MYDLKVVLYIKKNYSDSPIKNYTVRMYHKGKAASTGLFGEKAIYIEKYLICLIHFLSFV